MSTLPKPALTVADYDRRIEWLVRHGVTIAFRHAENEGQTYADLSFRDQGEEIKVSACVRSRDRDHYASPVNVERLLKLVDLAMTAADDLVDIPF